MFTGLHDYFIKLFFICAASVICEWLCENTKSGKESVGAALKVVCALCVCVTVFSVFMSEKVWQNAAGFISSVTDAGSAAALAPDESTLIEQTRKQLEKQICRKIFENYGINAEQVCIQFTVKQTETGTDAELSSLTVILPDDTPQALRDTVKSGCEALLGITADIRGG